MIRHLVLIRFEPHVSSDDIAALYARLAALCASLPDRPHFCGGPNVSPETGMIKGFESGFIIDFRDEATRDAYLVNPVHQAIGKDLVAAAVGGTDGIIVFDLAI